jgi:AbiTii-like protein
VEAPYASLKIERSQIARILDSVRSRVLDWALALERAGVKGEGLMGFSRHDKEVAATVTYNVTLGGGGSFAGNVGPVSDHGRVTATQLTAGTLQALRSLADEIQTHAAQMKLPAEDRTRLEKQAAALKEEIRRPTPDPAALQRTLTSIKTIAEIAAGDLIAAGILHAVGHYLPLIAAAAGRRLASA